jgi:4,5-dihydroxyphthalate decarboxylase
MTATSTLTLPTYFGGQAVYDSIRDGSIKVDGLQFDFKQPPPGVQAFRHMCRTMEYDISEMAVVAYFVAKEYGRAFTAIPAIVLGHEQHGNIIYNENVVKTPKDLEGKKVATRGYTVTPGVWQRGFFSLDYGVDLSKITWVCNDQEHVIEYEDPPNVTRVMGADLTKMLENGEVAAALQGYNGDNPAIKRFFPDSEAATREFYKKHGVFPIDHLVVIKDSVIEQNPWLPRALFDALEASKNETLRKDPHAHIGGAGIMEGDPLPYGLEANRKTLQLLLDLCLEQGVLHKPTTLEELFPLGF